MRENVVAYFHFKWTKNRGAAHMRCSILFHLLVPGGKWQTVMRSPIVSANCCNATFHKRQR